MMPKIAEAPKESEMPRLQNTSKKSTLNAKFCNGCLFEFCYCTKTEEECEFVRPDNEQITTDKMVARFHKKIIFESAPLWIIGEYNRLTENDVARLELYYVCFINDCLRAIRNDQIVYVYKAKHIRDIMRFQPDIRVGCRDGIYYVSLPSRRKKKEKCEEII